MLLARAQSSSCLSASRHPQPSSLSSVSFCRGSSFLQGSLAQTPAAPVHSFANTQTALLQAVAYGRSLSITASLSLLKAIRVLPTIELVASFVPASFKLLPPPLELSCCCFTCHPTIPLSQCAGDHPPSLASGARPSLFPGIHGRKTLLLPQAPHLS